MDTPIWAPVPGGQLHFSWHRSHQPNVLRQQALLPRPDVHTCDTLGHQSGRLLRQDETGTALTWPRLTEASEIATSQDRSGGEKHRFILKPMTGGVYRRCYAYRSACERLHAESTQRYTEASMLHLTTQTRGLTS